MAILHLDEKTPPKDRAEITSAVCAAIRPSAPFGIACHPTSRVSNTIKLMTLECSMLYVKDFARMREFYGNMLQSQPINAEWTDTWAFFDVGGTGFALHAIPGERADKTDPSSPPPKREQTPVKLIFAVEDISAERARLEAMGITVLQRSWQGPAESCDCIDPEGNIFQIAARTRLRHLFGRR